MRERERERVVGLVGLGGALGDEMSFQGTFGKRTMGG